MPRVLSRFTGEIVALGTTQGEETTESRADVSSSGRPLRVGDHVRKDQLLAVLWSKDLGEKKSEWIDAQSRLNLDRGILKDLEELYQKGATAERSVREAKRNVDADVIALKRADHTLLSWGIKEREMAEIRAEAEKPDRKAGERRQDYERWRVWRFAPQDGTLSSGIFPARPGRYDHAPVQDRRPEQFGGVGQPVRRRPTHDSKLPRPVKWDITVPSQPGVTYSGTLDQINEIIDANQHTALLKGFVNNSRGDLLVGQFVTANISIPPAANELEVPTSAVVEDGRDSIVFVELPGEKHQFRRQKVTVTRRYQDVVYVRANLTDKDALKPGDKVIAGGAVLLNEAMNDLPVEPAK